MADGQIFNLGGTTAIQPARNSLASVECFQHGRSDGLPRAAAGSYVIEIASRHGTAAVADPAERYCAQDTEGPPGATSTTCSTTTLQFVIASIAYRVWPSQKLSPISSLASIMLRGRPPRPWTPAPYAACVLPLRRMTIATARAAQLPDVGADVARNRAAAERCSAARRGEPNPLYHVVISDTACSSKKRCRTTKDAPGAILTFRTFDPKRRATWSWRWKGI